MQSEIFITLIAIAAVSFVAIAVAAASRSNVDGKGMAMGVSMVVVFLTGSWMVMVGYGIAIEWWYGMFGGIGSIIAIFAMVYLIGITCRHRSRVSGESRPSPADRASRR